MAPAWRGAIRETLCDVRKLITTTLLGALTNLVLGVLAVVPLGVLMSLLAYAARSPYPPQTNHTSATIAGQVPPMEIDGDEASAAVLFLMVTGVPLGAAFLGVNVLVLRRLAGSVPRALGWVAATLVVLLPFAGVALVIPLIVAALALAYRRWSRRGRPPREDARPLPVSQTVES